MESAEVQPCSCREAPHTPAAAVSQACSDAQPETSADTDGGTSCSMCLINHVDQHKQIKKEEPEDEGYIYGENSGEATPDPVGHITPVEEQNYVKKEEPENEDYLCGETSGSVDTVDQLRGFHIKLVKKEESEDEDFPVQKQSGKKTMSSYQSSPASGVHFLIHLNSASTSTSKVATPRNMRDL
ncbi:uncharacterized protein LOC124376621 isoform X3 [Silurus meridionalis]|uniref:uncharacterized protein LOC124376621 isoform X3 n=1 Tax=Silurus meridionalis TaxID=175797 RepID=UPI001EEBD708|nr:uncharacterized protein LOC124376621 isoform X3 [Silurus meridionalis]XP_046691778.1 uncharacterized protein LOC124376621 isoform X3 [Silurus meridionalis]XP_046691779.1 uncharacterized protein LOC124376621 isoform X3 [Silurus meridionalis]XP_046691780.1 uncharacterized protein LOC124376621 isoform X3 [Silurus meridionalis]